MEARVKVVRRHVNVRCSSSACVIRIRALQRRLHASRGVNLSLFGIYGGLFMDETNTNNVRVRAHRNYFKRGSFSIILGLFHAGTTIRRFHAFTDKANLQGLVNVTTVITNRLVSSFIMDRTRVAIFTLQRPTTDATFCRKDRTTAILRGGRLFLLFRNFFRVLCRREQRLSSRSFLAIRFLSVCQSGLQRLGLFVTFFRLSGTMFSIHHILPHLSEEDDHSRRYFDSVRNDRCGDYTAYVVAKDEILLLVDVLIFLIRGRRSRIPRERRGKEASSRGGVVTVFSRLFPPCLRPFNIKGLEIVGTRPETRGPLRAFYGLNDRNGL